MKILQKFFAIIFIVAKIFTYMATSVMVRAILGGEPSRVAESKIDQQQRDTWLPIMMLMTNWKKDYLFFDKISFQTKFFGEKSEILAADLGVENRLFSKWVTSTNFNAKIATNSTNP